jgi:polysaccharide biosynthesis transport protein
MRLASKAPNWQNHPSHLPGEQPRKMSTQQDLRLKPKREKGPSKKGPTTASKGHVVEDPGSGPIWLLRAIWKRWPIVAACALLSAGISLLYSKSLPRVYESAAMLEFDPDVVRPMADKTDPLRGFGMFWDNHEYYETQYKVMTSEHVLSVVVRDLGLQTDAEFLGHKPDSAVPIEDAADMLRARIRIEPVKNSRLVLIKIEDTNPKLARRLTDAVARTYINQNLEKSVSATGEAVVWLSGQLDHFKNELEQNENSLHEFKKRNDLPSSTLEEVSKMIRMEMQAYDSSLTATRTRKQELLARANELAKVSPENPDQVPASELLSNSFLSNLRNVYQIAIRDRRELIAEGKGENHPQVRKVDERISETRRDLFEELKNIQGAVQRDLAVIERQEQGEAALYETARKKAVDLNLKELEYHRLDRMRAENEKLYGALLQQMKEADLARMMNVNNIRLVDAAREPKAPIRPNTTTNVGIGILLGFFLGIGLALLREQLDSSIKSPEDVEQRLQITFLGMLPEVADDEDKDGNKKRPRIAPRRPTADDFPPELVVHERPLSGVAEAARTLRTNLMFMNPDKPYRRLLVTSAAPSEGKTTVACTIAISLAQGGQRVCIVDCDLRRPRLHRIFDRVGDMGLTNLLVGDASLDDIAQPTKIPNLWCVPAGPTPPNPADVLHSDRFRHFLEELSEKFDRVVLDSPPLVAVTDSAIISRLVDGTVFVVRAFKTTRALSRQGLRSLADVDAPIVGCVLNAVDFRRRDSNYYHYYYYKREGYRPVHNKDERNEPPRQAAPPN